MLRTRSNTILDYFGLPIMLFTLLGTYLGGDLGLVFGLTIGGGIGLFLWTKRHRHDWQYGAVYDATGNPQFMVKFCRCGEIQFDAWFKKEAEAKHE